MRVRMELGARSYRGIAKADDIAESASILRNVIRGNLALEKENKFTNSFFHSRECFSALLC